MILYLFHAFTVSSPFLSYSVSSLAAKDSCSLLMYNLFDPLDTGIHMHLKLPYAEHKVGKRFWTPKLTENSTFGFSLAE